MAQAQTKLFVTYGSGTSSLDALKSANADGSNVTTIASDSGNFQQPRGVTVDAVNQKVYVADSAINGAGIVRYNFDGSGRTVIVAGNSGYVFNDVAVDPAGGKLYFTTGSGTSSFDSLRSVNLNGTAETVLASDSGNFAQPTGIGLDLVNQKIYVTDGLLSASGGQGIVRYNLDGSGRTVIVPANANQAFFDVEVDAAGGKIYFTTGSGTSSFDTISSANLDGSGVTVLASDSGNFVQPNGLALDKTNGYLYVADALTTGAGLVRFNLNGTGRTVIIPPVANAITSWVALYQPVPPTVTGINPTSGPVAGGTSVTITGTNLSGVTAVKFGTTNASSFTVNSSSSITATSPAHTSGAVDVTVTTSGGTSTTSAADQFTFVNPNLSINDVAANEGNSGTTTLTFTVSLSSPAGPGGVSFNIATADGIAVAPGDYTAKTLTSQTIAAGNSSYTFNVSANGDTTYENNETFFVNVTGVSGATVTDSQGQGTITNDDAQPTLSINDVTANEGNSGTTTFTFTVSLSAPSGLPVTFDIATANGTAVAPGDYTTKSLTNQTIAAGNSSYTFDVLVNGDTAFESNENFFVNVTNVFGATVTDGQGQGTINNDDTSISVAVAPASVSEDGTTNLVYTFTRGGFVSNAQTVNFSVGGTATFSTDYTQTGAASFTSTTGTVSFAANATTATVTIDPAADSTIESDETVILTVTAGSGYNAVAPTSATGTIANDDFNTAPVADDQAVTTAEDTDKAITLTASDADNDTLTYTVTQNPNHGTLSGTAPNLTYTPNADYNGNDSFKFKVNDGTVDSNVATVSITITAANDTPVIATNNGLNVMEGDTATIIQSMLKATDVDGDTLTYSITNAPTNGTLKLNGTPTNSFTQADIAANQVTYTQDGAFAPSDSFAFTVSDGQGGSVNGTFNISITEAPSLIVTTTSDSSTNNDNLTSLREAIDYANSHTNGATPDEITFDASVFTSKQTIVLSSQLPNISDSVTITGSNAGVTVDATNNYHIVFSTAPNTTLRFLTFANGGSESVEAFDGNLSVENCTFTGCIRAVGTRSTTGTLTLRNSTVSGNGTGVFAILGGTATIENSTITSNVAALVTIGGGTLNATNSIIAGNNDNASNLLSTNTSNITVGDPGLDTLKDNGGPTKTHALLPGSPALNAGNSALVANGVTTDQRGTGYPRIVGSAVDIGAFEVDKLLTVTVTPTFSASFSEVDGVGATKVRITRTGSTQNALTVSLRSSDTTETTIASTATILAGESYVDVPVNAVDDNLIDGTQSVLIKATATGYVPEKVTLSVTDNEVSPSNLSLRLLPAAFSESKTGTAATLTVQYDRTSTATAVDVNLSTNDSRLNLPNSVQIPAGKRSVEVYVTVTADNILTGTKTATITADATNFRAANTTATIYDAQARISLSLAPGQGNTISEGNTNNQTVLRVTRNTPTTGALVVNLSLNKGAGQVSYPSSVTIADGAAYADFVVSSVDDSAVDGTQSVVVLASATGYGSSTAQLYVRDNDGAAAMSAFNAPDEPSK